MCVTLNTTNNVAWEKECASFVSFEGHRQCCRSPTKICFCKKEYGGIINGFIYHTSDPWNSLTMHYIERERERQRQPLVLAWMRDALNLDHSHTLATLWGKGGLASPTSAGSPTSRATHPQCMGQGSRKPGLVVTMTICSHTKYIKSVASHHSSPINQSIHPLIVRSLNQSTTRVHHNNRTIVEASIPNDPIINLQNTKILIKSIMTLVLVLSARMRRSKRLKRTVMEDSKH